MKAARILGFVLCATSVIALLYCLFITLSPGATINPRIIDSTVDKLFWIMLIGGCAGGYGVGAFVCMKGIKELEQSKSIRGFAVFTLGAFILGMYYTFMFGSPW
jgi:H+/Cl- antiporter ClcA